MLGAASGPGSPGGVPDPPSRPDRWAAEVARTEHRLAIGSSGAPVNTRGRGISLGWLFETPVAPTPTGGVPAVPPPSPSALLRLSEVPTAFAGREEASLGIGG